MDHPTIRALFNYWDRQRGASSSPARADIHPGDIRGILPEVFLLERNTNGRFYYRLAGTLLCQNARRELKGQRPLAHFSDLDRRKMQIALTQVAEKGAIFKAEILGTSAQGRTIEQQWIVLPLKKAVGRCDRLIGACVTPDNPAWLGRDPIVRHSILAARIISSTNKTALQELAGKGSATRHVSLRPSSNIPLREPVQAAGRSAGSPDGHSDIQHAEAGVPRGIAELQGRIERHFGRRRVQTEPANLERYTDQLELTDEMKVPNFNVVPLVISEKRIQHLTVFEGGRD